MIEKNNTTIQTNSSDEVKVTQDNTSEEFKNVVASSDPKPAPTPTAPPQGETSSTQTDPSASLSTPLPSNITSSSTAKTDKPTVASLAKAATPEEAQAKFDKAFAPLTSAGVKVEIENLNPEQKYLLAGVMDTKNNQEELQKIAATAQDEKKTFGTDTKFKIETDAKMVGLMENNTSSVKEGEITHQLYIGTADQFNAASVDQVFIASNEFTELRARAEIALDMKKQGVDNSVAMLAAGNIVANSKTQTATIAVNWAQDDILKKDLSKEQIAVMTGRQKEDYVTASLEKMTPGEKSALFNTAINTKPSGPGAGTETYLTGATANPTGLTVQPKGDKLEITGYKDLDKPLTSNNPEYLQYINVKSDGVMRAKDFGDAKNNNNIADPNRNLPLDVYTTTQDSKLLIIPYPKNNEKVQQKIIQEITDRYLGPGLEANITQKPLPGSNGKPQPNSPHFELRPK